MQHVTMRVLTATVLLVAASACTPGGLVAVTPAARSPATDSADLAERLDAVLRELEADGFSGAVMVAHEGRLVLSQGYGRADRGRGRVATDRTLFQLASVSKQFTAAAVLKLQEEGRLRLSDPIDHHLDDVPPDKRSITIHQLLTHTAGLPQRVGKCSSDSAALDRTGYLRHVLAAELRSTPGASYRYSNDGYGLLGAIIERASGAGYQSYLRAHLFAPAGMTRTGYSFDAATLDDAARGYGPQSVSMGNLTASFRNRSGPAWCNRASGGLLSTARDMYRWHRALRGDALLSQHSRSALWTRHAPESADRTSYTGYGWTLSTTTRGTRLAAHDGSLSGYFTADLRWYLDEDVAVFVAANAADRPAPEASRAIVGILFPPFRRGAPSLISEPESRARRCWKDHRRR